MKLLLLRFGHRQQRKHQQLSTELAHAATVMDESRLPTYTVLVPLYMESAEVVNRLVSNLAALDYPPEKLDIKLICEADDFAQCRIHEPA